MRLSIILFFFIFLPVNVLRANSGILDRNISVEIKRAPVIKILQVIEERAKVQFSYNPNLIDENKIVSLSIKNKTIAFGLLLVFNGDIRFKEVGNHIILLKNENSKEIRKRKKLNLYTTFKGVITDKRTKQGIENASIYDVDARYAVVSQKDGSYEIKIPKAENVRSLYVKKKGYKEVVFVFDVELDSVVIKNIDLIPIEKTIAKIDPKPTEKIDQPIGKNVLSGALVSYDTYLHVENLSEIEEFRVAQISLVPSVSIGSNLSTNGLIVNNFSLNILAGYSNGVEGIELGGILNIDREDVKWFQAGGVCNLVGGNVTGVQLGGVTNTVRKDFLGAQFGGIANVNGGKLTGFQVGGIFNLVQGNFKGTQFGGIANITEGVLKGGQFGGISNIAINKLTGIQAAGIVNFSNDTLIGAQLSGILSSSKSQVRGIQAAGIHSVSFGGFFGGQFGGISNLSLSNSKGIQGAGIVNVAFGDLIGAQLAGITNFSSGGISALQLSGITNYAKRNIGVQATGILNVASKNEGVQIGLINVSNESKGIALGLINFVRKGYHKTEFSTNEVFPINMVLKSGTRRFYNTYNLGYKPGDIPIYALGLGVGTQLNISDRWNLNLDLSGQIGVENNFEAFELAQLGKFALTVDYKLFNWLAVFGGPTYNTNRITNTNDEGEFETTILFNPIFDTTTPTARKIGWFGWRFGIRL